MIHWLRSPCGRWITYGSLLALGIPWYWPEYDIAIFFGFPLWVAMAIAVSTLTSVYTAWLLCERWPGEDDRP